MAKEVDDLFGDELGDQLGDNIGSQISGCFFHQTDYLARGQVLGVKYQLGDLIRDQVQAGVLQTIVLCEQL